MNDKAAWRRRAQAALDAYFRRRSFPRTVLTLLLLITGLAGFFFSFVMLRSGLYQMWLRYPIAVLASYGVLLGLLRIWIEIEKRRFDPEDAEIRAAIAESESDFAERKHDRRPSWLDCLDVPDFGAGDLDLEGCLPVLLLGAFLLLAGVLIVTIAGAPILIAEAFLDAFLVSVLYRRLRIAEAEHWLGTAIRKTWARALLTALALGIGGWALEAMAPGAHSIGRAVEQIRNSW